MTKIYQTDIGTVIVNGIEYNDYPAPSSIIKATEKKWAIKLIEEGIVRLSSIEFYQSLENPELGDRDEGIGLLNVNGHPMESRSVNEVYIWCCASPRASHSTLLSLSQTYDTIIRVHKIEKFVHKILEAARKQGHDLTPHIGAVNYNRMEDVTQKVLNEQKWHHNVFQKCERFLHQDEYRIAFGNYTFNKIGQDHIDLALGDCSDIIKIET